MSVRKAYLETVYQSWCQDTGERVDVGPDADGLGCIDIVQRGDDGKEIGRVTLFLEQAVLVHEGLGRAIEDLKREEEKTS